MSESQSKINELNASARDDLMRYALTDLDTSLERLKSAREAMTGFRTRTQILDPLADIEGRMGVLINLQQQLAQALIEYDLLVQSTQNSDPRLKQAERRIDVIRARIVEERVSFATAKDATSTTSEDYPTLIAEFERLTVDAKFAEETYRAALTAVDLARANASRQTRYLAPYIYPTLSESSEYPQRFVLIGLIGLFLAMIWSVVLLVYYSVRDRR